MHDVDEVIDYSPYLIRILKSNGSLSSNRLKHAFYWLQFHQAPQQNLSPLTSYI